MKNRILILLFALLLLGHVNNLRAQAGKDAVLTALGGTCGAHIYTSYLAIGAVADGYAGEVYDAATVQEMMDEQIATAGTLVDQYKALIKSGFLTDPSDKEYMNEIISAVGLLTKQATALRDYTSGSGTAEDFQNARTAAWEKISELLGLE